MITDLFRLGKFTLHAGGQADYKIDCDALNIRELRAIAFMLSERVPSFKLAIGIPRGGTKLADCMNKYKSNGPILIVDDVFTTGASMNQMRDEIPGANGAVIFARALTPDWVTALFHMTPPAGANILVS